MAIADTPMINAPVLLVKKSQIEEILNEKL